MERSDDAKRLSNETVASPESVDRYGTTPLMHAILRGDKSACSFLIQCNCNVNHQNSFGFTALMYASRDGFYDIVALLLEAGADPTLCGKSGYAPIICAAQNGFTSVVELLARSCSVNMSDDEGQTPLMCACCNGHVDTVCALLQLGADPYQEDRSHHTAFSQAVDHGLPSVVYALLQFGISPQYVVHDQPVSVLYVVAYRKQFDLVRVFLLYISCIHEFVSFLVDAPNVAVESIVLTEFSHYIPHLTQDSSNQLVSFFSDTVSEFLGLLVAAFDGSSFSFSFCGVMEACVWNIHCLKLLADPKTIPCMVSFMDTIEGVLSRMTEAMNQEAAPLSKRRVKLLFSLVEVYCVMCGSVVLNVASVQERARFQPNPRLVSCFQRNYSFLK